MTERTSVEHDGDRGSGEFTEDQWREFMMAVVSKTSRKIPVATVRGWVERMTEAFYDSVEALSSATALDLQEAAGVPHLVGKIIVQTAKDLNDLTEDEASKTSDAKVKVRTSQKKFGGSSGDVDVDEDDEEVTVSAKLDPAPAEGVGVSLEKVQMPIDDGSMDGSGVHHPDEASEEDLPEGDYEEQDEETADEGVDDEESPQKSATDSALESVGQSVMSMQSALMSQVAMQKVFMEAMRKFQPEMFRALAKATTKGEVSVKELVKATAIEVAQADTKAKAAKPKQEKPDRQKPKAEGKGKPSWQDRSAKGDLPKLVTAGGKLMSSKQMEAAKASNVCFDFMQGQSRVIVVVRGLQGGHCI